MPSINPDTLKISRVTDHHYKLGAVALLIAHNPFLLLVLSAGDNATPGANCDCYRRLTLPSSLPPPYMTSAPRVPSSASQ